MILDDPCEKIASILPLGSKFVSRMHLATVQRMLVIFPLEMATLMSDGVFRTLLQTFKRIFGGTFEFKFIYT